MNKEKLNISIKNNNYSFKVKEENIFFSENLKKYVFELDIFLKDKKIKTEKLLSPTNKKEDILKSTNIFLKYILI